MNYLWNCLIQYVMYKISDVAHSTLGQNMNKIELDLPRSYMTEGRFGFWDTMSIFHLEHFWTILSWEIWWFFHVVGPIIKHYERTACILPRNFQWLLVIEISSSFNFTLRLNKVWSTQPWPIFFFFCFQLLDFPQKFPYWKVSKP